MWINKSKRNPKLTSLPLWSRIIMRVQNSFGSWELQLYHFHNCSYFSWLCFIQNCITWTFKRIMSCFYKIGKFFTFSIIGVLPSFMIDQKCLSYRIGWRRIPGISVLIKARIIENLMARLFRPKTCACTLNCLLP